MKNIKTFKSFSSINEYLGGVIEAEGEFAIPEDELPILLDEHSTDVEKEDAIKKYLSEIFKSENVITDLTHANFLEQESGFGYFTITLTGLRSELMKVMGDDKIINYEW